MQPYQQAHEEQIRQRDAPINALKEVGGLALSAGSAYAGGAAGSAIAQRVLPLLSKYVPQDLAIKGLNKIDPRLGKFLQTALDNGESFEDAKAFIEEKASKAVEAKENRSVIEQYSPELHKFIEQEIKKGESPIAAASKASRSKKFEKEIKKMVHDHKLDWTSIVESVFGKGEKAQQQQPQQEQPQQQAGGQGLDPGVAQIIQQGKAVLQSFKGG